MFTTKTETEAFIETAAGFWRAIGELANVGATRSGDSLQREAAKAELALQKTLDREIQDWNDTEDDAHPRLDVCVSQRRYVSHAADTCEIYTVNRENGGYCGACAAKRAKVA